MQRFRGAQAKRHLIEALRQQSTLECCEPKIKDLAHASKVRSYRTGTNFIIQGSDDNRLAFILSGRVGIFVKGTKVAERRPGQHIGEMSLIDPSARRSATATALEPTTIAWVSEEAFTQIANKHPALWRKIARELADRLRQRGALLRDKNAKPVIFIGSSSESLPIARTIKTKLKADPVDVDLWKEGVFGASEVAIESLEKAAQRADFAVLILSSDDEVKIRRRNHTAPRDNVIFELGLFMGAIGRDRTFMIVEKEARLHLPADLNGITYLPFGRTKGKVAPKDINAGVAKIRARVSEINAR